MKAISSLTEDNIVRKDGISPSSSFGNTIALNIHLYLAPMQSDETCQHPACISQISGCCKTMCSLPGLLLLLTQLFSHFGNYSLWPINFKVLPRSGYTSGFFFLKKEKSATHMKNSLMFPVSGKCFWCLAISTAEIYRNKEQSSKIIFSLRLGLLDSS